MARSILLYISTLLSTVVGLNLENETQTVTIALMLENENSSIADISHFKPAFDIAFEEINSEGYHLQFDFVLRTTGKGCGSNGLTASPMAAQMLQNTSLNIHAFFGPLCYKETAAVADLASFWNKPVFSALDTHPILLNKDRFKTLVRMSHSRGEVAEFVRRIYEHFKWRHACAINWDIRNTDWTDLVESIKEQLFLNNIILHKIVIADYEGDIESALKECTKWSRVILFAFDEPHTRSVMLSAFDLNMVNGDYAFIAINTHRSGNILVDEQWKVEDDDRNSDAKDAYESLLWIRLYEPHTTRYQDFLRQVSLRSFQSFHLSELETHQIEYSLAAFHDSVILYAFALNETQSEGGDISDGLAVVDKLRDRDFYLHFGAFDHVTINQNLDRVADYSLWDMTQTDCGEFSVVANFIGLNRIFTFTDEEFVWPGSAVGAPNSLPFSEGGLSTESIYGISIGAVCVAGLLCFAVVGVFFRYKKMLADLHAQKTFWKIKWEDLTFSLTKSSLTKSRGTMSSSRSSRPGTRSTHRSSKTSIPEIGGEFRNTACSIAMLENHQVVVKKIAKEKVTLSSSVNNELKANRLAEHVNIARFYGACIEEPRILVVHQYCPRGSLRDFVQSGNVEADVKDILMIDIAKGLHYLHNSPVGCHGRLHWNNCVIDSRFVVQLTDYGLYEFRSGEEFDPMMNAEYMERIIWMSPEHLRNKNLRPSQKGDIYAMGLLLQVIATGTRPYDQTNDCYTPEQILEKVKFNTAPYFRPIIEETLCRDNIRYIMQKCWSEDPAARPSSDMVLKTVRRGRKVQNIVDQLLSRMEKYANKLEALVAEKTEEMLEEKRKAENLLYEVLPRYVATQLMQGKFVEPETYSSVTICFSDIVQFTEMSSKSTPMQVIGLLNNLYTTFDEILTAYDVYKVETIGDAYMVASGLPIRNGSLHAREIACVALALINAAKNINGIGHRSNQSVELRVGAHTGSCVAGVVGHTMPRYCLFGDTVNTASRMESSSEAQKIHISLQTKEVLDTFGIFKTQLRGDMEIKGKGKQTTFWLLGQIEMVYRVPSPGSNVQSPKNISPQPCPPNGVVDSMNSTQSLKNSYQNDLDEIGKSTKSLRNNVPTAEPNSLPTVGV